jgi:radical SAM superfamily enzyme YgiQ (UPF0313 family)
MRITFIRPNLYPRRSSDAMEPVCFAVLKTLTPPGVETRLFDERLEPIRYDIPTDLVAMTVETYTARRAYQIAGEYHRRGVPVVMGGYHPTFLPEEALQFADSVVCGDAEGVWEEVVEDARRNRLQQVYRRDDLPALGGLQPDRSIFRGKRYAPVTLVQYGRGCRYNCDFCSIRAFYGSRLRQRPIGELVEEVKRVGRKNVVLVDDNIFIDIPKAKALFEALIPLKIRWSCQASIDIARDRALIGLMQKSGCTAVLVGFETLDPENLRQMNKSWNLIGGDYESSIRVFRDAGIMIYGTFVFGYDRDTAESFDAAVDFAIQHRFYLANFNPLTPTPRAPLYDRLKNEGRLIHDKWWLSSEFRYGHATFHPRGMTAEELTWGCYRARNKFNTARSILRRALDPRANLRTPYRVGLYLLSNVISRREIHAKQDSALGSRAPLEARQGPVSCQHDTLPDESI